MRLEWNGGHESMRLIHEYVDMHTDDLGRPRQFIWRQQHYQVDRLLDVWTSRRRWWSLDDLRLYCLVQCNSAIMELYRTNDRWYLSRLAD